MHLIDQNDSKDFSFHKKKLSIYLKINTGKILSNTMVYIHTF